LNVKASFIGFPIFPSHAKAIVLENY
jgi:hypothetical protein